MQCLKYKKCSGCQLQNMEYNQQLRFKEIKVIRQIGKYCRVDKIVGMKNPVDYRNKAQYVFKKEGSRILCGIYQSADNSAVVTDRCMLTFDGADQIAKSVCRVCEKLKIKIFNSKNETGFLKHIMLRKAFITGEIMLVLVANSLVFPQEKQFVQEILKSHPEITTVVLNENKSKKILLGQNEKILFGNGYITDRLCGRYFRISPKSFYQVNHSQTEKLYLKAGEFADLKGDETVIDAFCGIGTIGITAGSKAKEIVGVESNESAVKDAIKNAELNRLDNAKYFCDDAGNFMEKIAEDNINVDVVFTDPPRSGCSKTFLKSLTKLLPKKIVYISCNPETLSRDLYFLTQNGYEVKKAQPFDLFPFTNHVETVVLMTKRGE